MGGLTGGAIGSMMGGKIGAVAGSLVGAAAGFGTMKASNAVSGKPGSFATGTLMTPIAGGALIAGALHGGALHRGAAATLNMINNNPRKFGALALGAYGISKLAGTGPGQVNISTNDLGRLAEQSGVPSTGFDFGMGASSSQQSNAMFMNSTSGLVQGLHRGRHRG